MVLLKAVLIGIVCFSALCASSLAQPTWNYTDDFARKYAFVYSAVAYAESDEDIDKCGGNSLSDFFVLYKYNFDCDFTGSKCHALLLGSDVDKTFVLTFRGSESLTQFNNMKTDLELYSMFNNVYIEGRVFSYFLNPVTYLWIHELRYDLQQLKRHYRDFQLWTFGYSLGGAMASVAGMIAVRDGLFDSSEVRTVTFGQPRTGDKKYAEAHDRLVPNTFRIVHEKDQVPQMPSCTGLLGLGHAFHHGTEVRYPYPMVNNSEFTVINGSDSCAPFSDSSVGGTQNPHNIYFDKSIELFYYSGCLW